MRIKGKIESIDTICGVEIMAVDSDISKKINSVIKDNTEIEENTDNTTIIGLQDTKDNIFSDEKASTEKTFIECAFQKPNQKSMPILKNMKF